MREVNYINATEGQKKTGSYMAVIKEIKYGSGVIRIHDDYCKNNTKEDNQKIIDNVSKIIIGYYQSQKIG